MTPRDATIARVNAALASSGVELAWFESRDGLPAAGVPLARLRDALQALRAAGFETPTFVTAVDRFGRTPRFEVCHQLYSLAHRDRIRLHTAVAEGESVPTCIDLWPGAAFMERECFDLFGIPFAGHAGLKRLMMPEGYGYHPLRKDFPHQGIEPDRLYREWDRERRRHWHPEVGKK